MTCTAGVTDGKDLDIASRHQFDSTFLGIYRAALQQHIVTGHQGTVTTRANQTAYIGVSIGFVKAKGFTGRAFFGLAVEAVVLFLCGLKF